MKNKFVIVCLIIIYFPSSFWNVMQRASPFSPVSRSFVMQSSRSIKTHCLNSSMSSDPYTGCSTTFSDFAFSIPSRKAFWIASVSYTHLTTRLPRQSPNTCSRRYCRVSSPIAVSIFWQLLNWCLNISYSHFWYEIIYILTVAYTSNVSESVQAMIFLENKSIILVR